MFGNSGSLPNYREARWIMGIKNFCGPKKVMRTFNVKFSRQEMTLLSVIPFSKAELRECRDSHILFAGYPLTIENMKKQLPKYLFWSSSDSWYKDKYFACKERVGFGWHLVRRDIVPGSVNKVFEEQLTLLKMNEKVPRVVTIVYLMALYRLTVGECLFSQFWARCRDALREENRIDAGFANNTIHIDVVDLNDQRDWVGLASARKFCFTNILNNKK